MVNPHFFINYVLFLSLLSVSYIIGKLYFRYVIKRKSLLSNTSNIVYFTEKIIFGVTFLIIGIALFYTRGETVQVIALLAITLFSIVAYKNKTTILSKEYKNNLLTEVVPLLTTSILIYAFHFYNIQLTDFVFYGKLSGAIIDERSESLSSLYSIYGVKNKIQLYHYGDLWLNGFIAKVFSLNNIVSLQNIIYPFFHTVSFYAIYGSVLSKFKNKNTSFVISAILLYGSSFLFIPVLTPEQGHHTFWFYGLPSVTSFKTLIIYPYIFLALVYLRNNVWNGFAILIVLCTVQYFTLFVGLLGGVLILLAHALIYQKLKISLLLLTVLGFLGLVYFTPVIYANSKPSVDLIHHIYPPFHYFDNFALYAQRFFNYFSRPIYLYPFVLLGVLMLYRKLTKQDAIVFCFIFCCVLSSSIFIALFFSIRESTQVLSNIYAPLMVFGTYIVIDKLTINLTKVFIAFLICFSILNIYSTSSFSKDKVQFTQFNTTLYNFSIEELQNEKWAYYSDNQWSTFYYSGNIFSSPLLLSSHVKPPIEIAPVFEPNSKEYFIQNPEYPLSGCYQSVFCLLEFFKQKDIHYMYVENARTVPEELLNKFKPIIVDNHEGIWKKVNESFKTADAPF